jgi:phosphoglycerate dehydrogenase-like enzyme
VEVLLLEPLAPEVMAWLEARHEAVYYPQLADDLPTLRKAIYKTQALVLPRKLVVTQEFLDFAPKLKAVARLHVGTDNTDLQACRDRHVRVIQSATANVRSNAEYLLCGLLGLYRRGVVSSLMGQRHVEIALGRELNGSVVGILGLAPTAHALAILLHAVGARLVGYDPAVHHSAPLYKRLAIEPVSLSELMARSDAVSVQMMYATRYRQFINDNVLAHCKPGQVWVGTSRTSLFDTQALANALSDGRINACMLDGAEAGFASQGSPLHAATNLFLTPRLGSHTKEALLRSSWYVAHRIHEALTLPSPSSYDSGLSVPAELQTVAADVLAKASP